MHQKIGRRRSSWPWVPLERIKRDLKSEEKKEEREVFVDRKKKRVIEDMKR